MAKSKKVPQGRRFEAWVDEEHYRVMEAYAAERGIPMETATAQMVAWFFTMNGEPVPDNLQQTLGKLGLSIVPPNMKQ